tara:strand:+ start:437 stop:1303 length:867 start_codon:yes stop_codon:yes gene_type:complete
MGLIDNKEIIYKSSKSFFWASRFLSSDTLQKVINIYSFCRIHDDIVDENLDYSNAENKFKREIEELKEIIKSYGISDDIISELMLGINSDIDFKRYKNNKELLRYCYRVAGVVGLMMTKALKIESEEANFYAIDLGIAMQLTNISRDIMQDFNNQRIYLPEDTGITQETLSIKNDENNRRIKQEVNKILLKSNIYYKSSLNGFRYIPIKSRLSILVALRIYEAIGIKIKRSGTKFLEENIYIKIHEKFFIVLKTLLEFAIFFIIPVYRKEHNPYLHENFKGMININDT